MFLNTRISPYVITDNVVELYEHGTLKGHSDPLLLCSSSIHPIRMPKDWIGIAYGTQETVNFYRTFFKTEVCKQSPIDFKVLDPYRSDVVLIESKPVEITAIPAGTSKKGKWVNVFLIEKSFLRVLAVNELPFGLGWLMHEFISKWCQIGIDVIYVNDILYAGWKDSPDGLEQQIEHQTLLNLVQAVRPKRVVGLTRTKLPQSLLNKLFRIDVYRDVKLITYNK